ncbi:hypothetical protein [Streptomyces sp. NPDC093707]|uniref:hypothetical protein n=1 Tax=Streptomyces sp. NPDC093707 TaxID=3154984 RepID=UPI00344BAE36
MARVRFCACCGARLPRSAPPQRRYCDDTCRAQAFRDRQVEERRYALLGILGAAYMRGDRRTLRQLTCPECGNPTFASAGRRRDARYCGDRCRARAARRRAARRARAAA